MKKIIFGALIGVAVGFYFSSRNKSASENLVQNPELQVKYGDELPTKKSVKETVSVSPAKPEAKVNEPVQESNREVSALSPSPSGNSQDTELSEKVQAQLLNLNVTEEQIAEMEENLSDLQKEVSFYKDNAGWIVRFHSQDNLLSHLGIKDNDLIRFGQIERLKQDPTKTELISRLEAVIETLQR